MEDQMPIKPLLIYLLGFGLILCSCTVSVSQQPSDTPSLQAQNTSSSPAPTTFNGSGQNTSSGFPNPYTIPVTWSNLHLSGKLIFPASTLDGFNNFMVIQELDLVTGGIQTIFQSVPDGWIDSAVISPDQKQIVMTYSTPALQQGANFTPLGLYSFPSDGSQPPQELVPLPLKNDQFLEPVWSPDGKYLYYVLANYGLPPEEPNQHFPIDQIFRVAYPKGQPEKLLDKAYWPRLSADGSRLIYVSENPDDGTNKLFVANNDGSNPQQIFFTGANAPAIIDAPMFLPDGKSILFSAPSPVQSSTSPWLDWLFGVTVASAHNIPSEWWTVPIDGGRVTQLTQIQGASLYASISPDNRYIASFSGNGIFVMNPDGTNLTMIISNNGGNAGTVNWIP
jgi:Tol biopolymer transport system component